jgi:AAA domain
MRDALAPLRERFQFIVLDCPPALDLLTLNALVAADSVLIPMQAEYFALEGISELLDTIGRIRQSFNPLLEVEGVVLTMFDERTNLAQQVAAELRNYFGEKLCRTSIPRNIRLAEAPSHGKPVLVYDVRSRGAESYIRLAKEVLDAEATRRRQAEAASQVAAADPAPVAQVQPTAAEAASEPTAAQAVAPEPAAASDSQHAAGATPQSVPSSDQPSPSVPPLTEPVTTVSDAAAAPEAQPVAEVAPEQAPSPPEVHPSLPPPAFAEAVIQAAQSPEAQAAVEHGD